jgi:hypothetical protein
MLRGLVSRFAGRGVAGARRPRAGGVGGVGGVGGPRTTPTAGASRTRTQDEAIGRGVRGLLRRFR